MLSCTRKSSTPSTLPDNHLAFCLLLGINCYYGRNFVVICGGTAWCETTALQNLKRKMWGTCHIFPLSEKVPHLIAPMTATLASSQRQVSH